jgi:hypothetical protein
MDYENSMTDGFLPFIQETDVVYISGNISNNPNFNTDFYYAAQYLRQRYNCKVINPTVTIPGLSYDAYMTIDSALIYVSDIVVVIDTGDGPGTQYEVELAKELGKKVLFMTGL